MAKIAAGSVSTFDEWGRCETNGRYITKKKLIDHNTNARQINCENVLFKYFPNLNQLHSEPNLPPHRRALQNTKKKATQKLI